MQHMHTVRIHDVQVIQCSRGGQQLGESSISIYSIIYEGRTCEEHHASSAEAEAACFRQPRQLRQLWQEWKKLHMFAQVHPGLEEEGERIREDPWTCLVR